MRRIDLDAIIGMWMSLCGIHESFDSWYEVRPDAQQKVRSFLAAAVGNRDRHIVVAVDDRTKEPVGFLHYIIENRPPIFRHRLVTRVLDVFVREAWRHCRQGPDVGSLLLHSVEEISKRRHIVFLVAHVARKNERACRQFWVPQGFKKLTTCLTRRLEVARVGK